ncbi:unnamed protein product, partial [Effrenium voratum]
AHCQCRGNLAARQENAEGASPWLKTLQVYFVTHKLEGPMANGLNWLAAQVEWAEPCVHGYIVVHNVGIHFG